MLYVRRWLNWLRRRGICRAGRVGPGHIDGFLAKEARRLSRSSMQHIAGTLRVFLRFLHMRGLLARDLAPLVLAPRLYALQHVPRFLGSEQLARVFAAVNVSTPVGLRDRAMLGLMVGLGLRRCEVAALRMEDLDTSCGAIRIPPAKGAVRWVRLTALEREPLDAYLKIRPLGGSDDHVFLRLLGRRGLEGISLAQVYDHIAKYVRAAGIQRGACHLFRHTFAQRLVDQGVPLPVVQMLLGHRRSQTTQIYTKVRLRALEEVAQNDSLQF
jgi:integrase/recombinase XerD